MKIKNTIFISLLISLSVNTYAQEPFDVNGYLIFEENGEYYNIVGNDTLKVIPDVITVKFKEEATEQQITVVENTFNLNKLYHAPTNWINYEIDINTDIIQLIIQLSEDYSIEEILINRLLLLYSIPNETSWNPDTWPYNDTVVDDICDYAISNHFHESFPKNIAHHLMQIDKAWDITTGNNEVTIGFMDSGTNIGHEDIGNGVGSNNYNNLWEHPELPGVYGWNFINNDYNINDEGNHGTMVASIACAKTNNGTGTFGVAGGWGSSGAQIMTLKVGLMSIHEHTLHQALFYGIQNGARVINMAWGGIYWHNEALEDAINVASKDYNCILIAAAGNEGTTSISWPARNPNVIAIGATQLYCHLDTIQYIFEKKYSNSNEGIELFAVASPYYYVCHPESDSYIHNFGETSGATAYASGIAALILSANPMLTNLEVADIMRNTADKIDTVQGNYQNGHSLKYGYGRLNAYQAVLEALDAEGEPYIEITGTVTWDLPRRQAGDVVVMPGAELTLTSTLYMQPDTRIIVRRGGKLVIDGGSVTSVGTGLRWRGIEVWGNSSQPQQLAHQGWVRIINEGSVKNSVMGIYTNRPEDAEEGLWEPGYTGGIVQGIYARFVNNKTALQFYPYNYPSVSGFTNCEFITYGYEAGVDESAFLVEITGINGINFVACSFENKCHGLGFYRSGIRSVNSYLRIEGNCLDTIHPCNDWDSTFFKGLKYGVYATAVSPNLYIDIRHTAFNKNLKGLYLGGITNSRVTSNTFTINTPYREDSGYGMYLDECTGYWVEDNEFRHDAASRKGIGVIVNNSGTEPNEIYRNRFHNLEQGISAQGNNKDPKTTTGLQILCNDFVDCDTDILIVNESESRGVGIAAHQGADSQNPQHMAGNLFHHHTAVDFNDINNEGEHIIYYYPSNHDQQYERVIPLRFTTNTVFPQPVDFTPEWNYNDGCPCRLDAGGGGQTEELKQKMAESGQQAVGLQESLGLMIDDGDTESLHWDVQMSTSPQAMQLYDELMGTSPWLSDTVVSASIIKEDVLVDAMLRDIMVANPHTAKSDKLMEELDQRWTPLPEYMKAQILQGKSTVSTREQTEALLARQKLNKARAVNSLARIWYDDADSLIWLWEGDNSLVSKYKLAFLHLELGQHAQGISILNNIPMQMNLSAGQQAGHQQIAAVYDILASLAQEGKNILEADSLQIITLQGIEEEANAIAGVYARNALLALQMLAYDEPILLPDLMKSGAEAEVYRKLLETRPPQNLGVFPVPTRDFLVVEYTLDTETKGQLEFTDATGRLIHTLEVSGPMDRQLIDTRKWKPGWYIAILKTQAKTLESVKFIISD